MPRYAHVMRYGRPVLVWGRRPNFIRVNRHFHRPINCFAYYSSTTIIRFDTSTRTLISTPEKEVGKTPSHVGSTRRHPSKPHHPHLGKGHPSDRRRIRTRTDAMPDDRQLRFVHLQPLPILLSARRRDVGQEERRDYDSRGRGESARRLWRAGTVASRQSVDGMIRCDFPGNVQGQTVTINRHLSRAWTPADRFGDL